MMDNMSLKLENIPLKMENTPDIHYNEDPMMSSPPLFYGETKSQFMNVTDVIHQSLYQPAVLSSSPTYTPLENVYLTESSLATSNPQYFGHSNSPSATMQTVYSYSTNVPVGCTDFIPSHPNLYRNPELNHLVKDEGIGSSPSSSSSSQSSSSPPLNPQQNMGFGQTVPSRPSSNYDCSLRSSSSSPASPVSLNYSTAPECSNCGIRYDIFWCNTHYLCRQCLPERPTVVATAPSSIFSEQATVSKRKRSTNAAKNINQVCTNCDATYSKLWRRSISTGDTVCNACGLYEKLHNIPRPKSMRKDTIQTRKRKPKVPQSPKSKKSPRKMQKKLQEETPVEQQQYVPNSGSSYSLPNYQTLQVRNLYNDLHRHHPSPKITTMSHQSLYINQRNDIYRHEIYNPVPPNDIINISSNMPSTNMQFTSS